MAPNGTLVGINMHYTPPAAVMRRSATKFDLYVSLILRGNGIRDAGLHLVRIEFHADANTGR